MEERMVTDGARALRAYLVQIDTSVPVFCAKHGLDRIQVQKAMSGAVERISVDLGTSIERATGGVVQASAWRSDTLRLSPVGRLPRVKLEEADTQPPPSGDELDGQTVDAKAG